MSHKQDALRKYNQDQGLVSPNGFEITFEAGYDAAVTSIRHAIQHVQAVKDGDEDGHYAQGFIDTRRHILGLLEGFYA